MELDTWSKQLNRFDTNLSLLKALATKSIELKKNVERTLQEFEHENDN